MLSFLISHGEIAKCQLAYSYTVCSKTRNTAQAIVCYIQETQHDCNYDNFVVTDEDLKVEGDSDSAVGTSMTGSISPVTVSVTFGYDHTLSLGKVNKCPQRYQLNPGMQLFSHTLVCVYNQLQLLLPVQLIMETPQAKCFSRYRYIHYQILVFL